YPQGAEQQLITAVTGREVPSGGGLPSDVGCLVHNVATTLAIRDAVRLRRPLVERPVTVTGDGVDEAG
ncbi:MAG: electron transport complex subunit RsxC, partial [Xanthomonadales bacterium]|nr:electron transport complex subunit RsxC [Xanthomonadales bacterium]NIO13692.1 electron transport complex subunit RsxC [Xanthomonadales bacterium]